MTATITQQEHTNNPAPLCECVAPQGRVWDHPLPMWTVKALCNSEFRAAVLVSAVCAALSTIILVLVGEPHIVPVPFLFYAAYCAAAWHIGTETEHEQIAANILTTPQKMNVLTWAAAHTCPTLRYAAVNDTRLPAHCVDSLAFDGDEHTAWVAYNHPNITDRGRLLASYQTTEPLFPMGHMYAHVTKGQHAYCSKCRTFTRIEKPGGYPICGPCMTERREKERVEQQNRELRYCPICNAYHLQTRSECDLKINGKEA